MAKSARSRNPRAFAGWLVLAYVPLAAFAMAHHEMWRDELHCWLVARDGTTPWDVVHGRASDGQPPLWYLLLWVLEKTKHDPRAMQGLHLGIAAADVWLFARFAPFGRLVALRFDDRRREFLYLSRHSPLTITRVPPRTRRC